MMSQVLQAIKKLTQRDLRILTVIERGMINHLYVPFEQIVAYSGFSEKKTLKILKKLNEMGLVQRQKTPYTGYILTSWGYDCLGLNALYKSGVLVSISPTPIGVGKESDVYLGLTPSNKKVAVKIHRSGRISFRKSKKKRLYLVDKRHISWLYRSRLSAKNEYEALRRLYPLNFPVPSPISWNRHIVITDYYEGIELFKKPSLNRPKIILDEIIYTIVNIFKKGKIVHGDLSEYNIMILIDNEDMKKFMIFDWPQWIDSSHPMALEYFKKDLLNILKFFKRKYISDLKIEYEINIILDKLT